jgi:hypothetical protein
MAYQHACRYIVTLLLVMAIAIMKEYTPCNEWS